MRMYRVYRGGLQCGREQLGACPRAGRGFCRRPVSRRSLAAVLHRALGGLRGLPGVLDAHDALIRWPAVVGGGGVEAHLVPIRVVQLRQNPADRGEVHPGVRLAERGEPGREVLDRFLRWDADGEVVETCGRFGAWRVEAQRELRAAVRVAHGNAHQLALLDELDGGPVTEAGLIPRARPGEVADRQLDVVDAVQLWRRHGDPLKFRCSNTARLQLYCIV